MGYGQWCVTPDTKHSVSHSAPDVLCWDPGLFIGLGLWVIVWNFEYLSWTGSMCEKLPPAAPTHRRAASSSWSPMVETGWSTCILENGYKMIYIFKAGLEFCTLGWSRGIRFTPAFRPNLSLNRSDNRQPECIKPVRAPSTGLPGIISSHPSRHLLLGGCRYRHEAGCKRRRWTGWTLARPDWCLALGFAPL